MRLPGGSPTTARADRGNSAGRPLLPLPASSKLQLHRGRNNKFAAATVDLAGHGDQHRHVLALHDGRKELTLQADLLGDVVRNGVFDLRELEYEALYGPIGLIGRFIVLLTHHLAAKMATELVFC